MEKYLTLRVEPIIVPDNILFHHHRKFSIPYQTDRIIKGEGEILSNGKYRIMTAGVIDLCQGAVYIYGEDLQDTDCFELDGSTINADCSIFQGIMSLNGCGWRKSLL